MTPENTTLPVLLQVTQGESQVECLGRTLGLPITDQRLEYPVKLGEGFVQGHQLMGQFWLNTYYTNMHVPVVMRTENPAHSELYVLFINATNLPIKKQIQGESILLQSQQSQGVFCYAPGTAIDNEVPPHVPYRFLAFTFRKLDLIVVGASEMQVQHLPQAGHFCVTELEPTALRRVKWLSDAGAEADANRMTLFAESLLFIQEILGKLASGAALSSRMGIAERDVQELYALRARLAERPAAEAHIVQLARDVGMSESKLKRTFKLLFGSGIYQYQQRMRVERAQELLQQPDVTVSDVADQVGYSNVSKFIAVFQKQVGVTPGQWRAGSADRAMR